MVVSHIHRKKPKGRAMHETMRWPTMRNENPPAFAAVFAVEQKGSTGYSLNHRIARATATGAIERPIFVYNIKRSPSSCARSPSYALASGWRKATHRQYILTRIRLQITWCP